MYKLSMNILHIRNYLSIIFKHRLKELKNIDKIAKFRIYKSPDLSTSNNFAKYILFKLNSNFLDVINMPNSDFPLMFL